MSTFLFRYYSLDVSYFKSVLDKSLLEFLWNRYWVNTLSTCNLLTVSVLEAGPNRLAFFNKN